MSVYYTIGRNGKKFYFNNGKRISEQEGIRLNATRRNVNERNRSRRPLKPCKPNQYRHPITNRCRKRNNFITPSRSPVRSGSCIDRSKVSLKQSQNKVVRYMNNHRNLLVVHGTGCGKTLAAVTTSQCYLDQYPRRKVILIAPTSLITNFKKEMKTYGVQNTDRYELYSYDKIHSLKKLNRPVNFSNKMLIIDEVHNLRNINSKKSKLIVNESFKTDKCLLLTATPYVNKLSDFIPLINILHGRMIVGTSKQLSQGEVEYKLSDSVNNDNLNLL